MTNPKYLSDAGYKAATAYVAQCTAREADSTAPIADLGLLLTDAAHGPITAVELATIEGEEQIATSFHGRNFRYFDPLDFCAITLGTAFGGGVNLNDSGQGLNYPKLRVAHPKGRAIQFLRILTDAQPWQVAKQHPAEGPRRDYHHLSRRGLSIQSVRRVWQEGKSSRVPKLGRNEFYAAVEWYWHRNHHRAGVAQVGLADHLRTICTAWEMGDRAVLKAEY